MQSIVRWVPLSSVQANVPQQITLPVFRPVKGAKGKGRVARGAAYAADGDDDEGAVAVA